MNVEIKELQNLLDQVAGIVKKYDDLALQSGENFNVFDIIGLRNDEVRMHSAMLANLLNAQGSHGMKGKFLELFIKTIEDKKSLDENNIFKEELNTSSIDNSRCIKEEHNYENGRIDLVIKTDSGSCPFLIENKIYAREQDKQLINYNNAYSNAKILFLTLYGTEPTSHKDDQGKDISDKVYCISYKTDIIKWLESCHKEASDKPLIREGIKHYFNLIKILTNQTIKKSMEKEIFKIIVKNPELVSKLSNNTFDLISNDNFVKTLIFIRESLQSFDLLSLNFEEKKDLGKEDSGIDFLVNDNYKMYYYFANHLNGLHIFITFKNKDKIDSIISSGELEKIFKLSENSLNLDYKVNFEIGIPISNFNNIDWVDLNNQENINDISMKIKKLKEFIDSQF